MARPPAQPDAEDTTGREGAAALLAIDQRHVVIEGGDLLAARVHQGDIYLPLRSMCDALGVSYQGQIARLRRDEVLADGLQALRLDTPGGPQTVQALHLECVPLWLAGLEPSRVKEEVRPRLRIYKRWVRQKVWEAFAAEVGLAQTASTSPASSDAATLSLEQVAELGRALTMMAEQQLAYQQEQQHTMMAMHGTLTDHEQRLQVQEGRMDKAAQIMGETIREVGILKSRLAPGNMITDEQAAEISELVKAIATAITRQEVQGKPTNAYQAVFGELYRRFRVSSYKLVRVEQYAAVIAWLQEYQRDLDARS